MSSRKPYVRKRYWNEPEMGWYERAYFFEVWRGIRITGGVFLANLWKFMTGRKGALTSYYPEETRADYAAHNRGKHILTQRPDGRPQCVACNMCATVCPAQCIEIDAAFDPDDPAHPKYPSRFEIDYSRCVFCGLCVELAGGRNPHAQGDPGAARLRPWTHVDHPGRAAELAAEAGRREALSRDASAPPQGTP